MQADDSSEQRTESLFSCDKERILDFSDGRCHISVRYNQIVVSRPEESDLTTPAAEVGTVILASQSATCSIAALSALMESGAAVVVCNSSKLPSGLLLPVSGYFNQTQRMLGQAMAQLPIKKRIWKQVVRAKIRSQASALIDLTGEDGGLLSLVNKVGSGDPLNVEAQAAQRYWPRIFNDSNFRRRRNGEDQNRLLNYGYAVLRATVGRAIVATGLHPSLGVHHYGRGNPFCLADDLMEPYRPIVDAEVARIVGEWGPDISMERLIKSRLVGIFHTSLSHAGESRPIFAWIGRTVLSVARILSGESQKSPVFFPDGLFVVPEGFVTEQAALDS